MTLPGSAVPDAPSPGLDRGRWRAVGAIADRLNRIDPTLVVRLRADEQQVRVLAWLATKALVGVTVRSAAPGAAAVDLVTEAGWLAGWLTQPSGTSTDPPRRDGDWLTPVPPTHGWQRLDVLPGPVVRTLVREGAAAHADAARLDLGARAADTLLDTPVVTVTTAGTQAELTNRSLSALVAMGFLPGSADASGTIGEGGDDVVVAVCGRWTRISTVRGSVFAANRSDPLRLG